jgi:hypothetical protein
MFRDIDSNNTGIKFKCDSGRVSDGNFQNSNARFIMYLCPSGRK